MVCGSLRPLIHQGGIVGGVTPGELAAARGRLEAFADDILESLPRKDQRARGECYLRGLMLEGRRKSVEPMVQRLGEVHYQALHHFVAVSPWDWRPVRRRLAERLVTALAPTAWAVDDTGFPRTTTTRWGCSASTAARWARRPTASWGGRSTPSPSRPAARWTGGCSPQSRDADVQRRAACHVPERVRYRAKWQLVLDMLDELDQWGLGRRCWSPTPATARWASSGRAG
jgi:hypothetical protein